LGSRVRLRFFFALKLHFVGFDRAYLADGETKQFAVFGVLDFFCHES
jgi:hypothetical protein